MSRRIAQDQGVIRTFICIEIPDSTRARIDRLQQELKEVDAQVSWTKPSNIHLTLKFLGAVEASRIEPVHRAVERAARGVTRFEIEVSGAGCFPSPRSPRTLWIGISEVPEPLSQLHERLESELDREGFARERRKFSPHLTIGRLRAPRNGARLAEALITNGFEAERLKANEVIVMRSDLKPTGSIYTRQAVIELA